MAISREGLLVSSLSGQLGSVVFYQGARAGVVAKRPSGTRRKSPEQIKRQHALQLFQRYWIEGFPPLKKQWNTFARSLPWVNRIGVRRNISGYNAYLSYAMRMWPFGESIYNIMPPPIGLSSPQPVISAVSFTAGGPYDVTVSNAIPPYVAERITIQTGLQYGKRPAPGSSHYIGGFIRDAATENYATLINAAGLVLNPGDVIQLRIFWAEVITWPSLDVKWTTTVL